MSRSGFWRIHLCRDSDLAVFSSSSFTFAALPSHVLSSGRPSPHSQYHHLQGHALKQGRASPIQPSSVPGSTYSSGNNILHSHSAYGPSSQEAPYYSNQSSSYPPATASAQYSSSGESNALILWLYVHRASHMIATLRPRGN
ncbi:hypothetical protein N7448_000802 [Penicillium atrosanguineum]|nr:hypothetical protein N7448_000802 [Penicillium atrosanguineum]